MSSHQGLTKDFKFDEAKIRVGTVPVPYHGYQALSHFVIYAFGSLAMESQLIRARARAPGILLPPNGEEIHAESFLVVRMSAVRGVFEYKRFQPRGGNKTVSG